MAGLIALIILNVIAFTFLIILHTKKGQKWMNEL